MAETIYTIPVNEAFDECSESEIAECPLCRLYNKFEADELDLILGASMMEPDVRIKTNKEGFCRLHYDMMLERKNRLGMALMLQSHLGELADSFEHTGIASLFSSAGAELAGRLESLEQSCYICGRIDHSFEKLLDNIIYLWENDAAFRKKLQSQKMFCLPHFRMLSEQSAKRLSKKNQKEFCSSVKTVTKSYFDLLRGDIDHFCRKFDYRFQDEPWGNAKSAVERSVKFLYGDIHKSENSK
ncbi:MAG: DUF6062 family protein [Clostridia bacterium]|nr:DUF6062 family protein [Clostridia bacterium]